MLMVYSPEKQEESSSYFVQLNRVKRRTPRDQRKIRELSCNAPRKMTSVEAQRGTLFTGSPDFVEHAVGNPSLYSLPRRVETYIKV